MMKKLKRQRLWLLSYVRMLGTRINFQLLVNATTEWPFGQHAPNGALNQIRGATLVELLGRVGLDAAGEQGVIVVRLLRPLVAGELDLVGVENNNKVARILMRDKAGAVFAAKDVRNFGGGTTKGEPFYVGHVPNTVDGFGRDGLAMEHWC